MKLGKIRSASVQISWHIFNTCLAQRATGHLGRERPGEGGFEEGTNCTGGGACARNVISWRSCSRMLKCLEYCRRLPKSH